MMLPSIASMAFISRMVINAIVCLASILFFGTWMLVWLPSNFYITRVTKETHFNILVAKNCVANIKCTVNATTPKTVKHETVNKVYPRFDSDLGHPYAGRPPFTGWTQLRSGSRMEPWLELNDAVSRFLSI